MSKTVLLVIAAGTEEIEAVVVADLLRRAGLYVRIAGENEIVTCSRGVKIIPDILIENLSSDMEFSAIVIPGGMTGTHNLMDNEKLKKLLAHHKDRGGIIAAICAAPILLLAQKLLPADAKVTSHPSVKESLAGFDYSEEKVVAWGNFITSRGAGTAIDFAMKLIEVLAGEEQAKKVAQDIEWKGIGN